MIPVSHVYYSGSLQLGRLNLLGGFPLLNDDRRRDVFVGLIGLG
jgi:hypothetical protein